MLQTDSDTNDGASKPISNNTFQSAQSLPNPVAVGGYVNRPGAGESGPLQTSGDISDIYSVNVLAGQVIELVMAATDLNANDLDLELYSATQVLVNASAGTRQVERLTVASAGQYFVRVVALKGASNYVLNIGQTGSTAAASDFTLRDEFVPGEVLARFEEPVANQLSTLQLRAAQNELAATHGLSIATEVRNSHTVLKLDPLQSVVRGKTVLSVALENEPIQFASDEDRLKYQTMIAAKELSRDSGVEWAQVNPIMHMLLLPNDTYYSQQRWHYEMINLPAAWNVTTGSNAVIAAVVDSGVRPHQELSSKLVYGFDFVPASNSGDGDGDDGDASDPGVLENGNYVFHGTHVAGTIGAIGNNGQGVAGIGWNVQIMPIRVLGVNGSGSTDDIVNGILYAARLTNRSGFVPPRRADVINLSLGRPGACSPAEQQAINMVRAAGVIVVAAAGNSNSNASSSPGNCNGVISVAAVGPTRTKASYSNYGAGVSVAAPGGESDSPVYSTYSSRSGNTYFSSYVGLIGTSMAAPHVTGVIALMKSVNPTLTPSAIDSMLISGALTNDIGPPGPDELGVGLIDALKSVTAAAGGTLPSRPQQLSVAPSLINFGDVVATSEVIVGNSGTGPLAVSGISPSATWLSAAASAVDASGLGKYRIQITRGSLSAGAYSGWIEFRGSVGPAIRVAIQMQVTATALPPNAGHQYVLLIDDATDDTKYQIEVDAHSAAVDYSFTNVAPGKYRIAAGTDLNNDDFICDDGEACAEYPVYGEATAIDVTQSLTNLNISTAFRSSVRTTTAEPNADKLSGYRRLSTGNSGHDRRSSDRK